MSKTGGYMMLVLGAAFAATAACSSRSGKRSFVDGGVAGSAGTSGSSGSGGTHAGGSSGSAGAAGSAGGGGSGGCECLLPHAAAHCVDGGCAILGCLDGYLDCNGDPADGCEVDPRTNVDNCGKCGDACTVATNGTPICVDAVCEAQCDPGFLECDGDPSNGCEASIAVFEDKDEDGYGISSTWKEACAPSPGWAAKIGDCDDEDAAAHPGQTNMFSKPNPKVGFDYNCDGVVTKQLTVVGSCSGGCKMGWVSSVASCGVTANYLNGCSTVCHYDLFTQHCH